MTTALVLVGMALITFQTVVFLKRRDVMVPLHTPGVLHGLLVLLLAVSLEGGAERVARCLLIATALLITAPVSLHAIAQADRRAVDRQEKA